MKVFLLRLVLAIGALSVSAVEVVAQRSTQSVLKGSRASMVRQNRIADQRDLTRVNERQLRSFRRAGLLVRLPEGRTVRVDSRLPDRYRWTRPWVRRFILQLSGRFHARFGVPLRITSAVRTVERQRQLIRSNPNAARGASRMTRSSHLTGSTIDITKVGLTREQVAWLRQRLALNERVGRIEVTEEYRQLVFHVFVIPPRE